MVHLARKAFSPAKIPFPLVHVDTGHNFPETLEFRDRLVQQVGATLHAGSVQASIDSGKQKEEEGLNPSRNRLQILTLLETLDELKADAALGGGRRDEEKARAKERFFSHRDRFGQWDPKNQRPELWNIFNGRKVMGEHFRVFPLSNWTEMDVWQYIAAEEVDIPSLYFSHRRKVVGTGRSAPGRIRVQSTRGRRSLDRGKRFAFGRLVMPRARGRQNRQRLPSMRSSPRSRRLE